MEAADSLRTISTPATVVHLGDHKLQSQRLESITNNDIQSHPRLQSINRASEGHTSNQQTALPLELNASKDRGGAESDEVTCTDSALGSAECGREQFFDVKCDFFDARSRSGDEQVTKNEDSDACDAPTAEALTRAGKRTDLTYCFGSAGWLFMYYFGVIKCLKELGLNKNAHCISCSGGALACAAGFCCNVNIDDLKDYVLECCREARQSVWGLFKLRQYTQGAVRKFSSPTDVCKISGRMQASVTVLPWMKNVRVGEFHSYEHMEQALLASSCLVPLAGLPVYVQGLGWCIDGALSDLQIMQGLSVGGTFSKIHKKDGPSGDATITVCPFYCSRADIKPSRYIPPWWAFLPPQPSELESVYYLGYNDTKDWLRLRFTEPAPCPVYESWAQGMLNSTARLMKEADTRRRSLGEYINQHVPNLHLNEHLPDLQTFQEKLPQMPKMPQIPNLRLQERLQEHLPQMPQMPQMPNLPSLVDSLPSMRMELPQCLSMVMKMDVSGWMWLVMLCLRQVMVVITAVLVYTELFLLALTWGLAATLAVVVPGWTPGKYFRRFYSYLASMLSPNLALHSTPIIGRFVPLYPQKLADLSVVFRILAFVMI